LSPWVPRQVRRNNFPAGRRALTVIKDVLILTIILIIALVESLTTWPHNRSWGYYPAWAASRSFSEFSF
jgi:hypothetical protein